MANYVDGDAMLRELERMIEPEAEDDYNKGWNNAIATTIDVMGMVYRLTDPDIVKHGLWGLQSYEIGGRTYRRWEPIGGPRQRNTAHSAELSWRRWKMSKWHDVTEFPELRHGNYSDDLLLEVLTEPTLAEPWSYPIYRMGCARKDAPRWLVYSLVGDQDDMVTRWAYLNDVLEAMDDARCATWEKTEVDGWYACSQCGGDTDRRTNYCPHCGAAMGW